MAKKALRKYVYFFGSGKADGKAEMKNLLGGKGANLAEMVNLGIPVPPGFTITTEVCTLYYKNNRKYPPELKTQVNTALLKVEKIMGKKFGDPINPLLVSVRSGARSSMPGMMETVLNVGLTTKTIPGLIKKTNNERFVYDAYRRLMMMYSDVVMEKAVGIEPEDGHGIRHKLEQALERVKKDKGYANDTDLTVEDLKILCDEFKVVIKHTLNKDFPDDPHEQLWGGIGAVFQSWMGKRAVSYRRIEKIPEEWGTAVNVQSMVFGNTGEKSATGVAFTRNPATGENMFFGEWLPNAQGEDVVAGIRTPNPVNKAGKTPDTKHLPSLE
ncbi:MAG: pyruvate, phosphate dikinase, partial [Nitrospirae bacterium]|nr:pyruvate, phosphate dikinase [Nitrospirota bacterium]